MSSVPHGLQAAQRTLRVIQLLGQRGSMRLVEVAAELGVSPSVAYRLLGTCCEMGFARQEASGGPYEAGPALHELALATHRAVDLRDAGAAKVKQAAKRLQQTVSICVLEGRSVRFVETIEGEGMLRVAIPIGSTIPAHYSAAGRVMLAYYPKETLQARYPSRTLERPRGARSLEWADLLEELTAVRQRGWAVQRGEVQADISAVAHVILDGLGAPRAAIVCTVPASQLTEEAQAVRLAERLHPFAASIQRRLRGSQ